MGRRLPSLHDELAMRAAAYVDRRGGAGLRRGGRGRGGAAAAKKAVAKLYALGGFSPSSYYATLSGGGEAGVASGFGILLFAYQRKMPGKTGVAFHRSSGSNQQGYAFFTNTTSGGRQDAYTGNNAAVISTVLALAAGDLSRARVSLLRLTAAGAQELWIDSVKRASAANASYTPFNGAAQLGNWTANTAHNQDSQDIIGALTYRGDPSDAQILALFGAARTTGDVPTKAAAEALMPGTAVTHRWSLRDTLLVPVTVVDGDAAPAVLADTVTGASVDAMGKVGSPVVRVIDPSTYPRTSYGALGFSSTAFLRTAPGAGFRGSPSGFTVRVPVTFWSLSGNEYFAHCAPTSGYRGWMFSRNATTLNFSIGNSTATISATKTLTAADLGYPRLLHLVYDGTQVEGFLDGVSVGKVTGAFVAATGSEPVTIGTLATLAAVGEVVYGLAGANYIATAAEVAADFAAWQRTARLADITAAKPDANRYELSLDVAANGGPDAGVPAAVQDRVGTDHVTRQGTNLQVSQRTERLFAYETTPILYGAESLSSSDFWSTAGGFEGAASGFMWELVFKVNSQAVSSAVRMLVAKRNPTAPSPGFNVFTQGTNTLLQWSLGGTGTACNSNSVSIAAADVGKLLIATGVWDAANERVRTYYKRAELGTGVAWPAATGTYAPAATPFHIGKRQDGLGADGVSIYGFRAGLFVPTLAAVQAMHDAVMATEQMATTDYSGRLSVAYRFNGGASPDPLMDLIGTAHLARSGSPTIAGQYARVWGW